MTTRTGTSLADVLRREATRQDDAITRLGLRTSQMLLDLHEELPAETYARVEKLTQLVREEYSRRGYSDGLRATADIIEEDY